ncbi:reverse transcriptase domain-containing protein [Tanacetum coccineum]
MPRSRKNKDRCNLQTSTTEDSLKISQISPVPHQVTRKSPNWNLSFELMYDASDFAVGAILGQKEVFAFEKFRSYLVPSKMIVHTEHSTFRHLFKKQDAKPRLIYWILLLHEFDIKIKDRKCIENVAADHLSRIENEETSDDSEVDDNFPGETLMEINTEDEPWFADFANYLASDIIPKGMTYQQKKKKILRHQTLLLGGTLPLQTYKTPTRTTPYKLIYGKNCHLPFEIEHRAYWAHKNWNPDLIAAGEK